MAYAAPLNSPTLVPLLIPTACTPPASAGCGATTQPITAFGAVEPAIVSTAFPAPIGFSGTWGGAVALAWVGTFTGTGPYPFGPTTASMSSWNFSGLNLGSLPTGTFVGLGDLDAFGGAPEQYDLTAFDVNGNMITSAWLDDVFFVSSLNCAAECVQAAMPEYQWTTGVYSFDGVNVSALNPTLTVWVATNTPILALSVKKFSGNNSLVLAAPVAVSEPDSLLLVGLSLAALTFATKGRRAG